MSEKKNTVSIRPFSSYLVFLFQTQRQKTTREWPIHTVVAVLNIEFIQSYDLLGAKILSQRLQVIFIINMTDLSYGIFTTRRLRP